MSSEPGDILSICCEKCASSSLVVLQKYNLQRERLQKKTEIHYTCWGFVLERLNMKTHVSCRRCMFRRRCTRDGNEAPSLRPYQNEKDNA